MKNPISWLADLLENKKRQHVHDQLQWQRFLLRTGVPASAHILDMMHEETEIKEYVLLRFWVMLNIKGSVTYRHVQTLLHKKDLPQIGQTIQILYCPDEMSRVLII